MADYGQKAQRWRGARNGVRGTPPPLSGRIDRPVGRKILQRLAYGYRTIMPLIDAAAPPATPHCKKWGREAGAQTVTVLGFDCYGPKFLPIDDQAGMIRIVRVIGWAYEPRTASLKAFAARKRTTVFALILMGSPVCG